MPEIAGKLLIFRRSGEIRLAIGMETIIFSIAGSYQVRIVRGTQGMFLTPKNRFLRRIRLKSSSRAIQRQLTLESLETRRVFAAYEVTTLTDIADASDNLMSLREAIALANTASDKDVITFAPSLTANGPAKLTLSGTELDIESSLVINGPTDARLTIDADGKSRLFNIGDDSSSLAPLEVSFSDLDLRGGKSSQGGAIFSTEILSLIGCTIQNSSAEKGGAIYHTEMLNLWESPLAYNDATVSGGALYSLNDLSIVDSTLAFNAAKEDGGAVAIDRQIGYLVVVNATITSNTAASGGGISGKSLIFNSRIANSIIAGNVATNSDASNLDRLRLDQSTNNLIGNSVVVGATGESVTSNIEDWKTALENDGTKPLLKNNGGKTPTIAIKRDGPAVDSGNSTLFADIATRTDQRGISFDRLARAAVDIGAYEIQRSSTTTTLSASNDHHDGRNVVFRVEVSGIEDVSIKPTGTVELQMYRSEKATSPSLTRSVTLSNGVGVLDFSEEEFGIYFVKSTYSGDNSFTRSIAPAMLREGSLVDYGDAPAANPSGPSESYPVTWAENGARHGLALTGDWLRLRLGKLVSGDLDGTRSPNADADSSDDGVSWPVPLVASKNSPGRASVFIESNATTGGKVDAWVDFNRDGDWDDPLEKILDSIDFSNYDIYKKLIGFDIPAGASVGSTFARFRISTAGGLSPRGLAFDGEVEDYQVELVSPENAKLKIDANTFARGAGVFVRDGMISVQLDPTNLGPTVFASSYSPEMQIQFYSSPASNSQTLIVNHLTLGTNGDLDIRLKEDRDSIRLLGSGKYLNVRSGETQIVNRIFADIDISGSGNNTSTVSQNPLPRLRLRHDSDDSVVVIGNMINPTIVDGEFMHQYQAGFSNDRLVEVVNSTPYHNPTNQFDVNQDYAITPIDVLLVMNQISKRNAERVILPLSMSTESDLQNWKYVDVNGDGFVTPLDVLFVINEITRRSVQSSSSIGSLGGTVRSGVGAGTLEVRGALSLSGINSHIAGAHTILIGSNSDLGGTSIAGGTLTANAVGLGNLGSTNLITGNGSLGSGVTLSVGAVTLSGSNSYFGGILTANAGVLGNLGGTNLITGIGSSLISINGSTPSGFISVYLSGILQQSLLGTLVGGYEGYAVRKGAMVLASNSIANLSFTKIVGRTIQLGPTDPSGSMKGFTDSFGQMKNSVSWTTSKVLSISTF